jgi:hypothetical protein
VEVWKPSSGCSATWTSTFRKRLLGP